MLNKNTPKHFARGFAMGCADIIPGVSGGTVALILGIYERLIGAIRSYNLCLLRAFLRGHFKSAYAQADIVFVLPLAVGLISAVLFCTKVIGLPELLVTHTEPIYGLFFGLIFGSILLLLCERFPLSAKDSTLIIVGSIATWQLLQFTPATLPHDPLTLFLSGMLATAAMLLPGISGSFMLLMAGQYATILQAIADADMAILLPFIGGAITGILAMARVIGWLLARFERPTMLLMIGVLIGSLWRIWPFQTIVSGNGKSAFYAPVIPTAETSYFAESLAAVLAGLLIVFMVHRLSKRSTVAKVRG